MAGSANRDDTARGCAALLGIFAVAVVCWLVWTAVMWTLAEWRWAWFVGYMLVVPGLARAIAFTWGEQRPFMASRQLEAWTTAVLTAVAAVAPVVILAKGWGTGITALLFAIGGGLAAAYAPIGRRRALGPERQLPTGSDGEQLPAAAASQAE